MLVVAILVMALSNKVSFFIIYFQLECKMKVLEKGKPHTKKKYLPRKSALAI